MLPAHESYHRNLMKMQCLLHFKKIMASMINSPITDACDGVNTDRCPAREATLYIWLLAASILATPSQPVTQIRRCAEAIIRAMSDALSTYQATLCMLLVHWQNHLRQQPTGHTATTASSTSGQPAQRHRRSLLRNNEGVKASTCAP